MRSVQRDCSHVIPTNFSDGICYVTFIIKGPSIERDILADAIYAMNEMKIKLNHVHLTAIILGSKCMLTYVLLSCEELGIAAILE